MRPHAWLGGGLLAAAVVVSRSFAPDAASAPAAAEDRVGFPRDYRTAFQPLRSSYKAAKKLVGTAYLNPVAAATTELGQLPYAIGSIIVFEWTTPVLDAAGNPAVEPDGQAQYGAVTRVDVMRRESGFGAKYGADRAGEWEFASYTPDGSPMADAAELQQCAQCHAKAASRDHVFRGRFPPIGGGQ